MCLDSFLLGCSVSGSTGTFRDADLAVLAALLKSVSPDPRQAATDILNHFHSFQHATRAERQVLEKIAGAKGADLILALPSVVTTMTREVFINASSYFRSINAAKTHFAGLLNGRRNEAFVVLYLDRNNGLIDEDIWTGGVDRASVYPREILRRAVLLDAFAVLIAHNHPSGDTTPSESDMQLTAKLDQILELIDVILLDHFIYGNGLPYSFRQNGEF